MNVAAYTGRLVDTPELKATNSGVSVNSFTIAVKRPFAKDKSDFIDCVAWKEKAEFICNYFQKGMKIEVYNECCADFRWRNGAANEYPNGAEAVSRAAWQADFDLYC